MNYNTNDLLGSVNNFGSQDIADLLSRCEAWDISPYDLKEEADSMGYDRIDDINFNVIFVTRGFLKIYTPQKPSLYKGSS